MYLKDISEKTDMILCKCTLITLTFPTIYRQTVRMHSIFHNIFAILADYKDETNNYAIIIS